MGKECWSKSELAWDEKCMNSVGAKLTINYWETDKENPATNDNVHKL